MQALSAFVIDPRLLRQYDLNGPQYACYPTADRFVEAFDERTYRYWLSNRSVGGITQPLSLYIHLPGSRGLCRTGEAHAAGARGDYQHYLRHLEQEIELTAGAIETDPTVSQVHWGGSTPTFLGHQWMPSVCRILAEHFRHSDDCECSIELDPRLTEPGMMAWLAQSGFTGVILRLQDGDRGLLTPAQCAHTEYAMRRVSEEARAAGFRSVRFDLAYGLGGQTLDGFNATLDEVLALAPDRIALASHACTASQRIGAAASPEANLQFLTLAVLRLVGAGYVYIGMDHFAKPLDGLAVALRQGRLHRNFRGYSTRPQGDTLGLGKSAISRVGPSYSRNARDLEHYYAALEEGRLPVRTGMVLTKDDLVRRAVIQIFLCQLRLSVESIEASYLIDFRRYFCDELEDLKALEDDGLVEVERDWIAVTPRGRLLVRAICMIFDRYVREGRRWTGYSKVL